MSANLEAKKLVVSEIVEKLKNAECMMVVSYSGLTVEQVTELRKQCRESNVHYCVLKNRLVNRALQELKIEGLDSLLEGPNAFVFSDKDVTAGPKGSGLHAQPRRAAGHHGWLPGLPRLRAGFRPRADRREKGIRRLMTTVA